jgi:protein-tyrosine phosphatase
MVCRGNLCRSPVAERLLRARLRLWGLEGLVTVTSAGTAAGAGLPIEPRAAVQLVRLGGDAEDFRSRRLTATMISEADLVLAMSDRLRAETLQVLPRALRKTFTLGELAGITASPDFIPRTGASEFHQEVLRHRGREVSRGDVPDPIGQSDAVHRAAADRISEDLKPLLSALVSAVGAVGDGGVVD